jgi:hypothetical protein
MIHLAQSFDKVAACALGKIKVPHWKTTDKHMKVTSERRKNFPIQYQKLEPRRKKALLSENDVQRVLEQ